LRLPVIETKAKEAAMACNRDALEAFVADQCYKVQGVCVPLKDFYAAFLCSIEDVDLRSEWTQSVVSNRLSEWFPVGRRDGNRMYVGNLSLVKTDPGVEFVMSTKGRLKRKGEVDED